MTPAEKLRANIRAHMKDHDKMSIRALARSAPVSKSALSDFLAEKNNSLTFDSMAAIAEFFDTTVGALLGEEPAAGPVVSILLPSLYTSELNPRKHFNQAEIEKLAHDIKGKGVLQNLVVRDHPDKPGAYLVIAGERRLLAVDLLDAAGDWPADQGLPCKIIEADDKDHILTALSENLEREDLDPLEEAGAYKVLVEQYGMTPLEIGGRFARDKRHILYRLSLLDLGEAAIVAMRENVIGPAIGRHIARMKLHELQQSVIDQIRDGTLAASEAAVRQRVGEILSRPKGERAEFFGEDGGMATHEQSDVVEDPPQTAEQHRHDYPGADAEAWIRANQQGNDTWVGQLQSPFPGAGDVPFDWPTPETALGAAAQCLASHMRDIRFGVDTSPAERMTSKALLDWANSVGAKYGVAPITGPQAPAEPTADNQPTDEPHLSDADNAAIDIENQLPAEPTADPPTEDPPAEHPAADTMIAAADTIEMGEDGWPVPKPGYFIEHPRAVDPEYQFTSVTLRGIGKMPEKLTLYDPRNQAHADYVLADEE